MSIKKLSFLLESRLDLTYLKTNIVIPKKTNNNKTASCNEILNVCTIISRFGVILVK